MTTFHLNSQGTTDIKPEMLSGVQTGNGTPHDRYNIRCIAHVRTNRKDDIFMQRQLVQNFTFILEWGQGSCSLTKHTRRWTYSALRHLWHFCFEDRQGSFGRMLELPWRSRHFFHFIFFLFVIFLGGGWGWNDENFDNTFETFTHLISKWKSIRRFCQTPTLTLTLTSTQWLCLTWKWPPPTHTNFSATSRPARELKFGTDTHKTNLIKIS